MSGKVLRTAIIGLVVLGGAGFGYSRMQAKATAKPELGRLVTAKTGAIAIKVSETGTLEPVTKVDVKSRVGGRLLKIFVRPGDRVGVGAPLATVDPTEVSRQVASVQAQLQASQAGLAQSRENYQLSLQTTALAVRRAEVGLENAKVSLREAGVNVKDAEVGLRDAEVALDNAKVGIVQAQTRVDQASAPTRSQDIQQAEQSVRRIKAQIADANRTLERRKLLLEKGYISQQEVDSARTQIDLAEADLASAQQRVELLKEGPRKEDIAPTQIGVDTAKMAVESAKIRVETAKVRVEQSKVRYNQAQVALKTAEVQLATERANARQAQVRSKDILRSQADVAQSENRLAEQSVQLKETRIVAPIAGEVTGKYLEEGELVASATAGFAQGAAIVTIADLAKMQVKVNVNEVDVSRLSVGLPVEIRVDGIQEGTFHGRVVSLAPASLTSTQQGTSASASGNIVRFEVKIAVTEHDRRLRPGMTANVDILLNKKDNVVVLPAEALRPGNKVVVVTGTGKKAAKEERQVTLGLKDDARVEILSGLKPGDQVEVPKLDAKDRRTIKMDGPQG
ncbi:efflux RND transporter periplasmic adaptor subunit [Armatimonas rosea]|uniref:HlyD family secretion protein n=1 Tax=Armatimonas rosea TaxID=685828 RepID=A0A7W9W789_ARMRO|nr:HlyD family secretion protein [Armatimonas rosea]